MKKTYMLDTNICSYIMREKPVSVLETLQNLMEKRHSIVISAITYSELRFGSIGKKASPKHRILVDEFIERLDKVLPWGKEAVEASASIKETLEKKGSPIGHNDTLIAGHALATGCVLVSNNTKEFSRVPKLKLEDWV